MPSWKVLLLSIVIYQIIRQFLTKTPDRTKFNGTTKPQIDSLQYITNKNFQLDDKYLMIEAFATWCGPCVKQIDHLEKLQTEFSHIHIISVSQETQEKVVEFINKHPKMESYTVATDPQKCIQQLMREQSVAGIPFCWIYDKQSKLIWSGHPSLSDDFIKNLQ